MVPKADNLGQPGKADWDRPETLEKPIGRSFPKEGPADRGFAGL